MKHRLCGRIKWCNIEHISPSATRKQPHPNRMRERLLSDRDIDEKKGFLFIIQQYNTSEKKEQGRIDKMELRELSTLQIVFIYNTYMKEDFPPDELKPLKAILTMMDKGMYDCLGLYRENEFVAYACLVKDSKREIFLLDYLAVVKEHRSGGYGSIFLQKMQEYYCDGTAILLECESERTAPDEVQRQIRRKRIGFYKRNGCRVSHVKSDTFQVEYDILYLKWKDEELDIRGDLERIYRVIFPPEVMEHHLHVWKRHNILNGVWGTNRDTMVEKASLCAALRVEKELPKVISLVGAGGKTTTMYQLADELAEQGKRVIITTSTHIRRPEPCNSKWLEQWQQVVSYDWSCPIVVLGHSADDGKLSRPEGLDDPAVIEALSGVADVILIEADGAKEKPLKVPAEYEPVLIPQTRMVIACAGLQAIGRSFEDACFRMESDGEWLRREKTDLITEDDLVLILMDERGSRRQVPMLSANYRIVLNQADAPAQQEQAQRIIRKLPLFLQPVCVVTAYERNQDE